MTPALWKKLLDSELRRQKQSDWKVSVVSEGPNLLATFTTPEFCWTSAVDPRWLDTTTIGALAAAQITIEDLRSALKNDPKWQAKARKSAHSSAG